MACLAILEANRSSISLLTSEKELEDAYTNISTFKQQ